MYPAAGAGAGLKRGRDDGGEEFGNAWLQHKPTPEQRLAAKKAAIDRGFGMGDFGDLTAGCCGDTSDDDDDDDESVVVVEDSPAARGRPALEPFTPAPWPYPTPARTDAVVENPTHPAAVLSKLVVVCDLFGEGAPPPAAPPGGGSSSSAAAAAAAAVPRAFAAGPPPHLTTLYWTDRRQGVPLTGPVVAAVKQAMLRRDRQQFLVVQTTEGAPVGVVDPDGALARARREMVDAANKVGAPASSAAASALTAASSSSSSSAAAAVGRRLAFHSTDSSPRRREEENITRVHCSAGLRTLARPVGELLAQHAAGSGGKGGGGGGGAGSLASDWALAAATVGAVGWVFSTHFTLTTLAAPLRVNEALFHAVRWVDDNNAVAGRVARANVPLAVPAMPPYVGGGGGGGGSSSAAAAASSSSSATVAVAPKGRPPVCPKGVRGIGPDTQAVITHALLRLHEGRPLFIAPSYG
jgi:hypothetical protein